MELITHVPEEEYLIPFGSARTAREGTDCTIVANLLMVHRAMQAARTLEAEGVSAEVIDVRTLVPLDEETILASVRKTGRLIIAEEDNVTGGWGAEVAARVAEHCFESLSAPIRRVAAPDTPVPFAPSMETFYVPSVQRLVDAVRTIV